MKFILETERLLLREFELEDIPAVFEYGSNAEVSRYTGSPPLENIDEAKDMIVDVIHADYKAYGYGRWALVYKADNKVIGFAGPKYLPELGQTDIGYRMLPPYWGKGIATEASVAVVDYSFKHLNLDELIGIIIPDNVASAKVLEKSGFHFYKEGNYYVDDHAFFCHWYKIENPGV
jgi:ribosomal-protein-alanine N-acetyltransferase